MKTIGIIGGMSWESSAEYYRLINQQVKARLGPTHSAELVMYSLDFHGVAQLELEDRWSELAVVLVDAANRLERAGAEFILLASNTAHKVADDVQAAIKIPLLHIADATAEPSRQKSFQPSVFWALDSLWSRISIEDLCATEESMS
jgi:aspartate racemase